MTSTVPAFPPPQRGASLMLSFRLQDKTTLILGSGPLAAARAFAALEADSAVVVLAPGGIGEACDELKWRAEHDGVTIVDTDSLPGTSTSSGHDRDVLESYLASSGNITLVCVTDTILGVDKYKHRSRASAEHVYRTCRAHNIPVNTTDMPDLCDFTFSSTHRFTTSDTFPESRTPLQVGVTTNGKGCRLAGRIRREIVARLPKEVGGAVEKVAHLRDLAKTVDADRGPLDVQEDEINEDIAVVTTPNRPVPSRTNSETASERVRRRMKWVAQVSEYWPLEKLSSMTDEDMRGVLSGGGLSEPGYFFKSDTADILPTTSRHLLSVTPPGRGKILLVGSGPGHPSLLTLATHTVLTKHADLVLSDKLVPAAVLAIIPKTVEVRIARKFPGNAEGAQTEMMEAAIEAAQRGLTVVRLKQGDPIVYGRAGEEVLYFRAHGYEPLVIPGVSSALAGPMFAGIPVTQRGVAESFVVCTGVGRAGKEVRLPGYDRGRTLLILMGVARLAQVLQSLTSADGGGREIGGLRYPAHTPIAVIERASMPDQRVLESTLANILAALESMGEQRPPGMVVVGWAVLSLWKGGDVGVLGEEDDKDQSRVERWLSGAGWRIREGVSSEWDDI